ncbi:thioredoxin domain-containing protein [Paeniglutamicibacter antarcticus]|uniref:Thioredoxin domain-containing protein n=1 Tax=Arthrobacter terrae TaxID=2935737 RepID=A0A931G7Z9_9MICC|nr:thioredoxin domain-containing protein [Arthrobacter terrae]MBG0739799.1 thioredoxin domain-containing protein [Arthrobacter terrae]
MMDPQTGAERLPTAGRSNALAGEPSAYLRQHADNPVHWQPFGDAAFAQSRARDVPVFLSIGYAACHWCHVMAHESFEDAATAAYLNEHFVAVKVDREERPDVDAVYMSATQAISGEGGWPMSVFLTPDGLAFHAGTYFGPTPTVGRPSFRQVLEAVTQAWQQRREAVERSAAELAAGLAQNPAHRTVQVAQTADTQGPGLLTTELLSAAVKALSGSEDPDSGGFGSAPKFPPSSVLEFLLRHAAGSSPTADQARAMAARTLTAMTGAALFDQLAGGFSRYSVTADWSLPHFEKMLYDNAALLRVCAHWLRLADGPDFPHADAERVVRMTADWLLDALRLNGGPFASSLDADTVVDGVHREGATYLWTAAELEAAAVAAGHPGAGGHLGQMMHVAAADPAGVGAGSNGSALHPGGRLSGEDRRRWELVAPELLKRRLARPQPERDEKVVAGWNGLAIAALADAGMVLDDPAYVQAAALAADYLETVHWDGGILRRVSHGGAARGIGGLLEDYAFCADGLLALYAASANERWYLLAEKLIMAAMERFVHDGKVADATPESEQVFNAAGRQLSADPFDNATASGTSAFAAALVSYAGYSGSVAHRNLAQSLLDWVPAIAVRAPRAAGWALATAEALLAGPLEVAVSGPDTSSRAELVRIAALNPSPGLIIAVGTADSAVPLLAGRDGGDTARAYVCREMVCQLPAATAEELRHALGE